MASTTAQRWRAAGYVIPLVVVIAAALFWSSYSTFQHAVDAGVPGGIAWSQFVVLDGTVVVTTPIWLSTVLPGAIRAWGGVIGLLALCGSLAVNVDQFGWVGAPAPLFAGLLIHVVGLVLRAYRVEPVTDRVVTSASADHTVGSDVTSATPAEVERPTPTSDPGQAEPEVGKTPVQPPDLPETVPVPSPVPVLQLAPPPPREPSRMPDGLSPSEIVFWLLDDATEADRPLPSGPELTAAVRAAGHTVNDVYGRTTKARWNTARKEVSA